MTARAYWRSRAEARRAAEAGAALERLRRAFHTRPAHDLRLDATRHGRLLLVDYTVEDHIALATLNNQTDAERIDVTAALLTELNRLREEASLSAEASEPELEEARNDATEAA